MRAMQALGKNTNNRFLSKIYLTTLGIGTALKILLHSEKKTLWRINSLRRSEIISLFNTFGRVSESVEAVQRFRMYRKNIERVSVHRKLQVIL